MSLREHQIESAYSRFIEADRSHVIGRISEAPRAPMPVTKLELQQQGPTMKSVVGHAAVRTGAAILLVPDPLPFVDEAVGFALLASGAYLVESER